MRIGIPKEVKVHEYRVGMVPAGVRELVNAGHLVSVERGAGEGVGFADADYEQAGAEILPSAQSVCEDSELIIKVKEPTLKECDFFHAGHSLFTYLHLAAEPAPTPAFRRA